MYAVIWKQAEQKSGPVAGPSKTNKPKTTNQPKPNKQQQTNKQKLPHTTFSIPGT